MKVLVFNIIVYTGTYVVRAVVLLPRHEGIFIEGDRWLWVLRFALGCGVLWAGGGGGGGVGWLAVTVTLFREVS